jgi:hypothetical protein
LELVPHLRIGLEIIALTRQQSRDRDFVILVRLYSELAAMMPVWNQRLVKLLNSEGERQVLGMAVADVAHQPVKNAI